MLQQGRQWLQAWWLRRPPATRALPAYLWRAARNFARAGSVQAAALAYYAIFSVFPLTLLLAVAIGNLVGSEIAQEQIVNGLKVFLPEASVTDIQVTIKSAVGQSQSFGLVALIAIIWAATGLFSNITNALDIIFDVPTARSLWRVRLVAILMGIALVVLVVASFLTTGVLRLLLALSLELNIWVSIGTLFLPLGLDVVIFALLFRFVPARRVQWEAVWPAALFGAVGWELAKSGFEWYLTNLATYSLIYGGIATGIVLLFWAYLIASLFLFSAELCARLNEWLIEQEQLASATEEIHRVEVYDQNWHLASGSAHPVRLLPEHDPPALPEPAADEALP